MPGRCRPSGAARRCSASPTCRDDRCARARRAPDARRWARRPTTSTSGGSARRAADVRGRRRRSAASSSSRPRGSWSTTRSAPGNPECPIRSRSPRRSGRRRAAPARSGHGHGRGRLPTSSAPSRPRGPWWHGGPAYAAADAQSRARQGRSAARGRRRGAPAPSRRGAAGPGLHRRRPCRLRPRLVGRPDLRRPRGGPRRPDPGPVERDADDRPSATPSPTTRNRRCGSSTTATLAALTADDEADDVAASVELAPYPLTRPMHYTSGTTGRPKGVTTGLVDEATARARLRGRGGGLALRPVGPAPGLLADVPHGVDPLLDQHVAGRGLTRDPEPFRRRAPRSDALRRLRPTTAFLVPTHLQRILQHPDLGADETFDSLRLLAHAGAPCPETVKRATMARARPGVVWEFYGSTEAQYTVCSPDDWLEHPGHGREGPVPAAGSPRLDRRRGRRRRRRTDDLVDEGAIWCEQPDFARFTYWRNPEATANAWRGSACTVGDLGRLDEDGFLYLSGPPPRPHHQRRRQRVPGRGRERALRRAGRPARWRCSGCPTSSGARGSVPPTSPTLPRGAATSRRPCGPRLPTSSPRTSGPRTYIAARDLPHTATGKLMRRAVPQHLGLAEGPGG